MKIDNTRITPSNKLFSTNPQKTSSTIPIRKLTTLKLSLTSKYITISSSVKGASTSTSRISPTTKSTTSLTNVNSVNTTITKYSIIHSSLTKPGRNTSSAVSSKGVSATVIPTVKTKSTTDPALSPITKTSAAPLCDKASSLTFEAIRSKVGIHICYIKIETYYDLNRVCLTGSNQHLLFLILMHIELKNYVTFIRKTEL